MLAVGARLLRADERRPRAEILAGPDLGDEVPALAIGDGQLVYDRVRLDHGRDRGRRAAGGPLVARPVQDDREDHDPKQQAEDPPQGRAEA